MDKDFTRTLNDANDAIIDEHGFAAILQEEDRGRRLAGIIGGPRVNPTRSGLWIEDCSPAAVGAMPVTRLKAAARCRSVKGEFDTGPVGPDYLEQIHRRPGRAAREPSRRMAATR